jgi:hypothetical protein
MTYSDRMHSPNIRSSYCTENVFHIPPHENIKQCQIKTSWRHVSPESVSNNLNCGVTLCQTTELWCYTVPNNWIVVLHCAKELNCGVTLCQINELWCYTVPNNWIVVSHCAKQLNCGVTLSYMLSGEFHIAFICSWTYCLFLLLNTPCFR